MTEIEGTGWSEEALTAAAVLLARSQGLREFTVKVLPLARELGLGSLTVRHAIGKLEANKVLKVMRIGPHGLEIKVLDRDKVEEILRWAGE